MEIFGVYLVNQGSGETVPLYMDKSNIIGRGVPNPQGDKGKVLLPHPSISKIHAKIELAAETHKWILYDMSRHGVKVNGKKVVKEQQILHGDQLQIGPFTLMFYEKFKADDETAEAPLPDLDTGKKNSAFLNGLGAVLLVAVAALVFPKYLIVPCLSLFIFSFIFLVKPAWKKKVKISYTFLFFLLFLGVLGLALVCLRIYY